MMQIMVEVFYNEDVYQTIISFLNKNKVKTQSIHILYV